MTHKPTLKQSADSSKIASRHWLQFVLTPFQENNKNLLALTITAGRNTPYYYKADGIMEAYVRVGNESMRAPDYILNELILKGTNQSFDALITDARKKRLQLYAA